MSPGPGGFADQQRLSAAERRDLFLRIFPSVMLPMYLAIGDQTTLASALPAIVGSLGEAERISWIMAAYLVANTIAAPVYGYVGDVFGRRKLMFVALGVYIAAAIFCSMAPNVWFLIAGRMVQGLGGGGLMSLSQALIGEAVPPRERGNFQGYMAGIGMAATAIGPILGGYITQHLGWRYVFILNVPLALIAVGLNFRLQAKPGSRRSDWQFDFQGLVLFVAFILPVMFGLEQAQRISTSALPRIGALFLLAGFTLFVLIRHERRIASPLLPINLLRRKTIWQPNVMALCQGAMLTSMITFLPVYVRVVRDAPLSVMGWLLLPMTAALSVGSIIVGRIVTMTGMAMILPSFMLIPGVAMLVYFAIAMPHLTITQMSLVLGAASIMLGSVMSVVQITVQIAAGPKMLGAAAASIQFSRSVGAAFGTALFATVLFATLTFLDPEAAHYFAALLDSGSDVMDALEPSRRQAINSAIATAFQFGFLTSASFTAVSLVLAWLSPQRRLA